MTAPRMGLRTPIVIDSALPLRRLSAIQVPPRRTDNLPDRRRPNTASTQTARRTGVRRLKLQES